MDVAEVDPITEPSGAVDTIEQQYRDRFTVLLEEGRMDLAVSLLHLYRGQWNATPAAD